MNPRKPHLIIAVIGGSAIGINHALVTALATQHAAVVVATGKTFLKDSDYHRVIIAMERGTLPETPFADMTVALKKLGDEAEAFKSAAEKLAAQIPIKQTAYERANPNQPFYAKFRKREKRRR